MTNLTIAWDDGSLVIRDDTGVSLVRIYADESAGGALEAQSRADLIIAALLAFAEVRRGPQ